MKTKILVLTFLGVAIAGAAGVAYWLHSQNLSVQVLSPLATSTPVVITEKPPIAKSPAVNEVIYATTTLGNFEFSQPTSVKLASFRWEGPSYPGTLVLRFPEDRTFIGIRIFTDVNQPQVPTSSFNPTAKTLSDYEIGHPVSEYGTRTVSTKERGVFEIKTRQEVLISNSESVVINGIPMLRQQYSLGSWSVNNEGQDYFDTSFETNLKDYWRYVFFDGKTFVITTSNDSVLLDSLMQKVHLVK